MKFWTIAIILSGLSAAAVHAQKAEAPKEHFPFPPLPQAVSSFGAAVADGWVYVYGGHRAKTHDYSTEAVVGKFYRLNVASGKTWEELPSGPALQGLAVVAHQGKIYRIGGMEPRNKPGDPVDNRSVASADCYDPQAKQWTPLPDLPAARSSHDAVVVGDKIIVAGGWNMLGAGKESAFFDTALILDLKKQPLVWLAVPQPFQRRALTAAVLGDKVYVLGGMDPKDKIQLTVNIFDPASGQWTTGPDLPGPRRNGFAAAAVTVAGKLYVSTGDGKVARLSAKGDAWEEFGQLGQARIVHRIVPASKNIIMVLGGAWNGDNIARTEAVLLRPAAADAKFDLTSDLEKNLRALEKEIAAVRGLEFKTPVKAKIIPRPAEAAQGIQGYYSPKEKSLFLYEDIKGSYQKGVLIHEMVHALQDQHFDLAKLKASLHSESYSGDAELALAALIEGDATYTMIEVLKKENPKVAAMLDSPLGKAKNLQNAFLYAQGARYVKAMKDRGGWMTVNFSYKFPPRNTATIFGTFAVSGIDLGPGKVQGAYAIFKMLNENRLTADLAEPTAKAWRGDRTRELDIGRSTVIACATKESAASLHDALIKLSMAVPAAAGGDEKHRGFALRGQRVWTWSASSEANLAKLLDQIDGPPRTTVYSVKDKRHISFGDMAERLLDADLICVGEKHDSELCHRVQLQIIKAIAAYDDRLGVGMEMFQRPFQKELDRYIKGATSEEEFLKASEYKQRWGYDWSLYQPIVEYCRHNKLPLAALNAPKELTSRISKVGLAKLTDEEKKQLGSIDFEHKEHRDHWYEKLGKLHGDTKSTPEQKERSYQVMTTWDGYMAQSAAQFQQERSLRRLVVLAGSGHIDRGFGIPQRTSKRTGGKVVTIRVEFEGGAENTIAEPVTDYIVIVK